MVPHNTLDTSNWESEVDFRHVISCAGLSNTVVTGVLDKWPLSEPAAHKYLLLTHGSAVLPYMGVQTVSIHKPVNVDISGT